MRLTAAPPIMRFHPLVLNLLCIFSAAFAAPLPVHAQATADVEIGDKLGAAFHGSDIDTITLTNEGLTVNVPLMSYPQRGGKLRLDLGFRYYSPTYTTTTTNSCRPPAKPCSVTAYSGGPTGSIGDLESGTAVQWTRYTLPGYNPPDYYWLPKVVGPDGSVHFLGLISGNIWESLDATGYRYDSGAAIITAPDGNNYAATSTGGIQTGPTYNTNLPLRKDPSGNEITGGADGTETDTLGRVIPPPPLYEEFGSSGTDYTNCTGSRTTVNEITWSLPGLSGGTYVLKFCYANVQILQGSCGSPGIQCLNKTVQLVQSIVLPDTHTWTFEYADDTGALTQITRPTGGTISYVVGSFSPCEGSNTYRFGPSSRTVSTQDGTAPDGTWQYSYSLSNNYSTLTAIVTDPLGNDAVHQANAFGAYKYCSFYETEAEYYNGSHTSGALLRTEQTTYSYSSAPNIPANYQQAVGVVPIQKITTLDNGMEKKEAWSYDPGFTYYTAPTAAPYDGASATVTYGRDETHSEYDYGPSAPGNLLRTTTSSYLALNNASYLSANLLDLLSSVQTSNGSGTQVAYTTFGYDEAGSPQGALGNQTSIHKWLNTSGSNLVTSNVYDSYGRVTSTTDPKGNSTTYAYTSSCYAGSGPTSVTNALNQITTHCYDFNTGLLTSTTDPNSQTISFSYDPLTLRNIKTSYPDGGQLSLCYSDTASEGCAAGPPYQVTATNKITSSINFVETGIADGLGRLIETEIDSDPAGADYKVITFDAAGHKASETNPYRSTSDPTYGTTSYQYDGLDRTTLVTRPDGSTVKTAYCGNSTLVTDEAGHWRRSIMDGVGRLIEVDEPNSSTASVNADGCPATGDPIWATTYGLDALDDLVSVSQGGSRNRSFVFDSLKRLTSSTNPETGTVAYVYDSDSNVQTKTDARGITITYSWDKLNRLTSRAYSNGDPTVSYAFDQTQSGYYNIGHLTSMTDAAGSESLAYEKMGRLATDQRTTNSITKSASYVYNLDGSLATLNYPSGHSLVYTVGGAGLPLSASDSAVVTYAASGGYTPWGARRYTSLGLKMSEVILYNTRMQPCWVYAPGNLTATSCTATYSTGQYIDLKYNWNLGADNGNLVGTTNDINASRSQSFSYDQVNRITNAGTLSACTANCWSLAYGQDQWGDVLSTTGTGSASTSSFTIQASIANQITTSPFSYDADGNLLSDVTSTYAWNAESEMKTGGGVNYLYDGDSNRVEKQDSKLYWYGPNGEVLDETDMSGGTTNATFSEYIYFAGDRIARRDYQNNVFYYFEDQVHTSRVIAEIPNGGTSSTLCYDADFYPYGGEDDFTDSCQQNYKFQGKERDSETGNDYFGARFYSSTYGRFLSPDWSSVPAPVPYANLSNPQTLNLYAFVRDNPESFADLDGHGPPNCSGTPDHPAPAVAANASPANNNCHNATPPSPSTQQKQAEQCAQTGCKDGSWWDAQRKADLVKFAADALAFASLLIPEARPEAAALEEEAGELGAAAEAAEAQSGGAVEGSSGGPNAGKRFSDADRREDAGKPCTYCKRETTEEPGHPNSRQTDHIYPRSRGGNDSPENRAPACAQCNQSKGARTPSEWRGNEWWNKMI